MPKIPLWATETPNEQAYSLVMSDSGGDSAEELDLTRDEYNALKRHLAAMRGYTAGGAAERVAELAKEMELTRDNDLLPSGEPQQVAVYLAVAREFYRRCPEAVVSPEDDFETALKELANAGTNTGRRHATRSRIRS